MEVKEHMSATQLKEIYNERKHLNPKGVEVHLRILREDLERRCSKTFEESFYTYHTDDAVFYSEVVSSGSYWGFAFLNKKFILKVDMGRRYQNLITISFHGNTNKPTEEDKREVVKQLFDIIENADVFLLEDMTRHNTTIEFIGI